MLSHLSPPKILLKVILKQNRCYQISGKIIGLHFLLLLSSIPSRGKVTTVDVLYGGYCNLHEIVVHHSFMSQRVGGQTEESLLT